MLSTIPGVQGVITVLPQPFWEGRIRRVVKTYVENVRKTVCTTGFWLQVLHDLVLAAARIPRKGELPKDIDI